MITNKVSNNNFTYQINTTNISFIKMHKILKKLKIKENKFFLRLYDKSLLNVDYHDENIKTGSELAIKIELEIRRNPWFFFREIVRIPVAGGTAKFELHRGNLASLFCIFNNFNFVQILPRQHYKTTSLLSAYLYIFYFGNKNSTFLIINKEYPDSKRNLKHLKDYRDLLPQYLIRRNKADKNNTEYIYSKKRNNTITAISSPISEDDADKKGRGNTAPLMNWDEFAFLKHNSIMYGAAVPAASQAKIEARKNNNYYGTSITTTPNELEKKESLFCKKHIIDKACLFDENYYNCSYEELFQILQERSQNNFFYIEFTYQQLGKDEKWFKEQCRDLLDDTLRIKKELLLEWPRSSDTSVFSEDQLDMLYKNIREPVFKIMMVNEVYPFYFYEKDIDFNKSYILSGDVATGKENDASTLSLIDPISLMTIAEFRDNNISLPKFQDLIVEVMIKYFPNCILALENNSMGTAVLDWLVENKPYLEHRIYYEINERIGTKIEYDKKEVSYKKKKTKRKVYGVNTNPASRKAMIDLLIDIVNENPELISTRFLYSDVRDLERNKKGKIEHCLGGHDDSLFGYLIGIYLLAYGKNLQRFTLKNSSGVINTKNYEERKESIENMTRLFTQLNNRLYDEIQNHYNGSLTKNLIKENEIIYMENKEEKLATKKKTKLYTSILDIRKN